MTSLSLFKISENSTTNLFFCVSHFHKVNTLPTFALQQSPPPVDGAFACPPPVLDPAQDSRADRASQPNTCSATLCLAQRCLVQTHKGGGSAGSPGQREGWHEARSPTPTCQSCANDCPGLGIGGGANWQLGLPACRAQRGPVVFAPNDSPPCPPSFRRWENDQACTPQRCAHL